MEFMSMYRRGGVRHGTVVAAALITAAGTLAAQRPAATRPRDSVFVRVFAPNTMSLDSLRVLLQEFDREQYGTPRWVTLSGRIDSLVGVPGALTNAAAFMRGMLASAEANRMMGERRGWVGLNTQGPNRQMNENGELFVTQFAYPLIVTVDPQSPAEKAGIMGGDVLVAYNGVDVVNHEFNLTTLLKPDSRITVTVRRDGETKDFPLVVAKAPQRIFDRRVAFETFGRGGDVALTRVEGPDGQRHAVPAKTLVAVPREGPFVGSIVPGSPLLMIAPNGVFGASMSTVNSELAKVLNVRAGVLVNDVPEDSPAWRAGLRIGDVITAVQDQPIVSLTELREVLVRARARAVALQVASRNQKTRTVSVSLTPSP
jgi:hypothetical protein